MPIFQAQSKTNRVLARPFCLGAFLHLMLFRSRLHALSQWESDRLSPRFRLPRLLSLTHLSRIVNLAAYNWSSAVGVGEEVVKGLHRYRRQLVKARLETCEMMWRL